MSGFIVKAKTHGGAFVTKPLREGYDELIADLAASFNLIPASVTLFSKHNGTQLWVYMGSKGDLDVVLAEASEWGSHVINVEVSGMSATRGLDAISCLLASASTVSQLLYLWWLVNEASVSFLRQLEVWVILGLSMLVHLGGFAFMLDDETSHNHPFRQWVRPMPRRSLMMLLAPFSGNDALTFVSCGLCGLDAPLRASTRERIVRGGVWTMLLQDGMMLSVLHAVHFAAGASEPLSSEAELCLYVTLASLLVNAPRRLANYVVDSCEAAYREKEELADDAQISMFASQKMAARAAPLDTPQTKSAVPSSRQVGTSPSASPARANAASPPHQPLPPSAAGSRGAAPSAKRAGMPPPTKARGRAAGGKAMM